MAFYAAAGAAAYAAFRVAAEFAAILVVRHYSNALDPYMWLLLAVRRRDGVTETVFKQAAQPYCDVIPS